MTVNFVFPDTPEKPVIERGDWLATCSGGMWSIEDPHPSDVIFTDIVAGLSRVCRYAGQIRDDVEIYVVSEHSVLMTDHAIDAGIATTQEEALAFLLHDGSEAFFGDVPSPIKRRIPEYKIWENRAQTAIYAAFGVTPELSDRMKPQVKLIDRRIRLDERAALIREPARSEGDRIEWQEEAGLAPLNVPIHAHTPFRAMEMFSAALLRIAADLPAENSVTTDLLQRHIRDAERILHKNEEGPCP